jgi:hypothetical protein
MVCEVNGVMRGFAALSVTGDVRAAAEVDVAAGQPDQLGDP